MQIKQVFSLFIELFLVLGIYIFLTRKAMYTVCKKAINIKFIYFYALLLSLLVIMSIIWIQAGHEWGDDYSCYIAQAKAIVTNSMQSQIDINTYIVSNSNGVIGPGAYPWGFPFLLALVIKPFGINYVIMKIFIALFFGSAVIALYKIYLCKMDMYYARIGVLLIVLSPAYLTFLNQILSDIPFVLLSVLSVFALDSLYKKECGILNALALILLGFGSYFIRTQGIIILLTMVFIDAVLIFGRLIKKVGAITDKFNFIQQKPIIHIVIYAGWICLYLITNLIFPQNSFGYGDIPYGNSTGLESIKNCIVRAIYYIGIIKDFFGIGDYVTYFLAGVFVVLVLLGIIKLLFVEPTIIIYIVGTACMLVLFPDLQGFRYLLPVMPWCILVVLKYIQGLYDNDEENNIIHKLFCFQTAILVTLVIAMFFVSLKHEYLRVFRTDDVRTDQTLTKEAIELYDYIDDNTSESDVFAFFKPRALWLNTGRKGFSYGEINSNKIDEVDYILLLQSDKSSYAYETVNQRNDAMKVFENEQFVLYRMNNH